MHFECVCKTAHAGSLNFTSFQRLERKVGTKWHVRSRRQQTPLGSYKQAIYKNGTFNWEKPRILSRHFVNRRMKK